MPRRNGDDAVWTKVSGDKVSNKCELAAEVKPAKG